MATKKITPELFVLSDYATTSKDGKLSIMGIFDRIFVKTLPVHYPRFFVVLVLKGEPSASHQLSLEFNSSSGKKILENKQINITFAGNGKANIITDITNLHIGEIGEHQFTVNLDDKPIASTSLHINQLEANQNLPN